VGNVSPTHLERQLRRDECGRCGSDMDSLARPGECADERCRGKMVEVIYTPFEETYAEAFNAGRAAGYQDGIKTALDRLA
jgi:hypothetical protein